MKTKKPMVKETVGALYYAFNTPNEKGEFDVTTYEETNFPCMQIQWNLL